MFFVGFFSPFVIFLGVVFGDDVGKFIKAIRRRNLTEIERIAESVDLDYVDLKYSIKFIDIAISTGDPEITRILISKGWDKVVRTLNQYGYSRTPLYALCKERRLVRHGAYEIMEALLKAGAIAGFGDSGVATGTAPLHIVRNENMARLLISYGADVEAKNDMKRTPAHLSLLCRGPGVLKALADGGADFSVADCNGDTMFHLCRPKFGLYMTREIAIFLAQKGAPLEALNHMGETPLTKYLKGDLRLDHSWRLSWRRNYSQISYENLNDSFYACLLAAGADINTPNKFGERLIHIAVREFDVDVVKWLVENGADVNSKNAYQDTPLLVLLKFGEPYYFENRDDTTRPHFPLSKLIVFIKVLMKVLVDSGADVKVVDGAGYGVRHYLEKHNLEFLNHEMALLDHEIALLDHEMALLDHEMAHLLLKE